MTFNRISFSPRGLLAAGLFFGVAAAQAAGAGYSVRPDQEALVAAGMSAAEVRAALGPPAHDTKYMANPGRTWTYTVSGSAIPAAVFDVNFGADGRVTSVSERTPDSGN
jgi:outer membrane protein assembly factor BamE (lipoprotein component of BamABCDE complex)